jgi:hypothetical protein
VAVLVLAAMAACAAGCSSSTGGAGGSASSLPSPNGGSLVLSGQSSDAPMVLGTSPCNAAQDLQLQGLHGSTYRFLVKDGKPGILTLAAHSSLSIDITASSTGGRSEWRGGNGAGSGVITAPSTAGSGGPGMFTINATLPPTSGGSAGAPEHVKGSWMCS